MSNLEGIAPESLEAQALKELQEEGYQVGEHQSINDNGEVLAGDDVTSNAKEVVEEQPKADETTDTPKADETVEEPSRTPKMVEAWKLKVAEDQKESAIKQAQELQAKLEKLSEQNSPITSKQKEDIADDIKAIAEESGVDADFLEKFANTILKKAESKVSVASDMATKLNQLIEAQELAKQEAMYDREFAKEIEPLVKEQYGLSDTALSQMKNQLKDLAFSETYMKVPLAKIFKAEFDSFGIKEPKRSSEGKGVKVRSGEVIDLDNLTEEQFNSLSDEQIEKLSQRNSGGWNIPK